MRGPFEASVQAAIAAGVEFLLQQQDSDGFWREFDLEPGASEAWTTAWVGWCLSQSAPRGCTHEVRIRSACGRAVAALCRARTKGGWGYNRGTGVDADTTAWVLRFLTACGFRLDAQTYLAPYIDAGGGVHTFRELDFGAWTDAHDDVAANVGLALLATASKPVVDRVQRRLAARFPGETYWWSTQTYGVAWSLRFLNVSHGLSNEIRSTACGWIGDLPASDSSFEVVHRLLATAAIDRSRSASLPLVNRLLDLRGCCGWPGSSFLLVPPRETGGPASPNPELRGLLTTAICVRLLSEWMGSVSGRGVRSAFGNMPWCDPTKSGRSAPTPGSR
ncbi:MAG TPA: hypothetical protein VL225_02845 [Vicinamibacterales bacterium]|jgi:hypothetical protein|nr:hypothetical protein [Vicinamibacterales bacterium]